MPAPSPGRKRVPRWRAMISPPATAWPANTFTPRRCACESRPLRLEPRPFLCAIAVLLRPSPRASARPHRDLADLEASELGAVPHPALIAALGLELEHVYLLAALVPVHDCRHLDLGQASGVEHRILVAEEDRLELHRVALLSAHAVHEQGVALLDAVLPASDFDDGVHELERRARPRGASLAAGFRRSALPNAYSAPSATASACERVPRRRRRRAERSSSRSPPAGWPSSAGSTSEASAAARPTRSMRTSRCSPFIIEAAATETT